MGWFGSLANKIGSGIRAIGSKVNDGIHFIGNKVAPVVSKVADVVSTVAPIAGDVLGAVTMNPELALAGNAIGKLAGNVSSGADFVGAGARSLAR